MHHPKSDLIQKFLCFTLCPRYLRPLVCQCSDVHVTQNHSFSKKQSHNKKYLLFNVTRNAAMLRMTQLTKGIVQLNRLHFLMGCFTHRHLSIIDCLSFVMCPLLAPLVIVFFSFFVAVVYSTNEANKAGGMHH